MQEIGSLPNHFIRSNLLARGDVMWWCLFVEEWNVLSLLWDLGLQRPNLVVYTNAFSTWECGAFLDPIWFQLQWSVRLNPISIAVKEVFSVALAAAMFGHLRVGKVIVIQFVVDNMAVVDVIKASHSNDLHMMHLIQLLVFLAFKYNFWFTAMHVAGRLNVAADASSRNNMSMFFMQAPQADSQPTAVATALLLQGITWSCKSWIKLFRDTLQ